MFKFLRRLREYDRKVEDAQKETAEILGTVKEGLFLLDADFRIGSQFSASLSDILGRPIQPGEDFRALLNQMVAAQTFSSACDYIGLLFGDRVKESLVKTLNPLVAVEVAITLASGAMARRFLTIQFNRVMVEGAVSHLLVTVSDVTSQVALERALAEARKKAKIEVEIMLDLLKLNPAVLSQFLASSERAMLDVNDHLRNAGSTLDYRSTVDAIFRRVHALKGEAATLGLEVFETLAQEFEVHLSTLRQKSSVTGEDLLGLPLPLEEFLQRIAMVRQMTSRLAAYHEALPVAADDSFAENLEKLALRVAGDQGKEVRVVSDLGLLPSLPRGPRNVLKDIAVQLLRNAIAHGIEPATERETHSKPAVGNIYVALKPSADGEYEFVLRDDGRGLAPQRIREALLRSGRYSEAHLSELDDRQVVMKIFEPGVSTVEHAGRDAGHGVGMDVVKQKVQELGARLRIASRQDAFTQFSISFAV